jgi:hypothetical protein
MHSRRCSRGKRPLFYIDPDLLKFSRTCSDHLQSGNNIKRQRLGRQPSCGALSRLWPRCICEGGTVKRNTSGMLVFGIATSALANPPMLVNPETGQWWQLPGEAWHCRACEPNMPLTATALALPCHITQAPRTSTACRL